MQQMFGGDTTGGIFDIPGQPVGQIEDADIVVIGVPIATPYQSVGPYCAGAPRAIRSAFGWPGVLEHYDFDTGGALLSENTNAIDWGDMECSEHDFSANRAAITRNIGLILENGAIPVVLGGDDSVPIPVLQAYQEYGPLTVLQLDAHIDWRDEVQGEKMGLSSNMRRASEMGWVKNIVQVGARGTGSARPRDRQDALDWGVQLYPMREVVNGGIEPVIDAIADNDNLYIALDIDVMDPAVVPGVIGPAPGGFGYWDIVNLLERACAKSRVAGFSLVEFMPGADIGGRGALVAARITATIMGMISRQRSGSA